MLATRKSTERTNANSYTLVLTQGRTGLCGFVISVFVLKGKLACFPGCLLKLLVTAQETCAGWFVSPDGSQFPGVGWGAPGETMSNSSKYASLGCVGKVRQG